MYIYLESYTGPSWDFISLVGLYFLLKRDFVIGLPLKIEVLTEAMWWNHQKYWARVH
jgi:hypothetical protein